MSFTYYYRNCPPGIGCQPSGFDPDTREYWCPRKEVDGVPYHGQVSYPEPLECKQVWQYELVPADPVEHAEYIFWREQEIGSEIDLRFDYLNTDRETLEALAKHDALARAALVLLDALEESKRKRESPIGFKYYDPAGRLITVVGEDPIKGPGYYLVEREDGAQWGVKAEMLEPVTPEESVLHYEKLHHKESENASP